jgi:hypothetical protein
MIRPLDGPVYDAVAVPGKLPLQDGSARMRPILRAVHDQRFASKAVNDKRAAQGLAAVVRFIKRSVRSTSRCPL